MKLSSSAYNPSPMLRSTRLIQRLTLANRYYSTANSSIIGKKIETEDDLDSFFNNPTWSTSDLLKKEEIPVEVSNNILDRLMELSGLSKSITTDERSKIINSLNDQLNFITKLKNIEVKETHELSRLVDDKSVKPLDYDTLIKVIEETKPELSQGELDKCWNPLSLAKEHQNKYYLVKEGLIKNNK